MTKAGFGFIFSGLFVYFLASQTQIGWLYLFDAIIWGFLVLAAITPWYSLKSLKVERHISPSVFVRHKLGGPLEDETIDIKLTLTNSSSLAKYFIKLRETYPFAPPEGSYQDFSIVCIQSKTTTTFSYRATCYKRGRYPSANLTLQATDPLGLVVKRRSFALPLNLTVYPVYYQTGGTPVSNTAWAEKGYAVRSSVAEEFYGSREYRYGDPLKHIHWRNTARLGQFMLKEFEQVHEGTITVVFGIGHERGKGRETTFEYGVRISASLAKLCADSGRKISIHAGKTPLYEADWQEAMDHLAHIKASSGMSFPEYQAVVPEPGQVIVTVASTADGELVPPLLMLARQGKEVVMLLKGFDPDEKQRDITPELRAAGIHIVECEKGNLEEGIKRLVNSPFFAGTEQ